MQLVVEDGAPGEGGGPGAANVGLPDHRLTVVGGVRVGGGAQLWRWGEALHVAGFLLQGPVGDRSMGNFGKRLTARMTHSAWSFFWSQSLASLSLRTTISLPWR